MITLASIKSGSSPSTEDSNIILLFGGQKLKSNNAFENIGVEDGSVMNAIPNSITSKIRRKSRKH